MLDFSDTLYSVNVFSSLLFFICQLRLLEPKYFNIEEIQALILFLFFF